MAEEETPPPDLADTLKDAVGPSLDALVEFAVRIWWFWLLFGLFLLARRVALLSVNAGSPALAFVR
jgi:hypothetical protein